jgi:hypothetical protein
VPVWIERFALAVFAAAFFSLVILNLPKMDWIQRTGLGIGLVGFSIFLAQCVQVSRKTEVPLEGQSTMGHDEPKDSRIKQKSEGEHSTNTAVIGDNNQVTINLPDPTLHSKLDEITNLLKAQGGEDKLLKKYPLGYVVFNLDYVTNAVTPFQTRQGLERFQYDFRPVRVLRNTDDQIAIQLPDLIENKKVILTGNQTGGTKKVGNLGGYMAQNSTGVGVMVWGEILAIRGSEITFLVGFDRAPTLPGSKSK